MEQFDLVEKLVNTFGVSYEEAKNALEASGWDPVEAAVILERNKNAAPEKEAPALRQRLVRGGSHSARKRFHEQAEARLKSCTEPEMSRDAKRRTTAVAIF